MPTATLQIPVHLASPSPRIAEPLTFGVPLPRGMTHDVAGWRMVAGDRSFAVAAWITERWSDGSIRWALIDTQCDITPGMTVVLEISPSATGATPTDPMLRVTDRPDGADVDTGAAVFQFRSGGAVPCASALVNGETVLDTAMSGMFVTDAKGTRHAVRAHRVAIEHQGRLRAVIRIDGTLDLEGRRLETETRVECFAGLATARVLSTIRNADAARHSDNYWDLGDPGSLLLKDVSIVLAGSGGPARHVRASLAEGSEWIGTSEAFELYQDSSGGDAWQSPNHINRARVVPVTFRGYRMTAGRVERTGNRATPLVWLETGPHAIAISVPQFWQNCPKAIDVDITALTLRLFPRQYADLHELQGGEQKTHEWYFAVARDGVSDEPLGWTRQRTVAIIDPAWTIATGAVEFLAALEPVHRAIVDTAVEGTESFAEKRERVDQFGWRHFGDVYGDHEAIGHRGDTPLVSHYNNQYDPILGFGLQFLRTGDPRWRHAMDELASHVIDIDVYHTTKDKAAYNGGLFWHTYHYGDADTSTHRTYPKKNTGTVFGGGPSADHNYPSGLVLRYFLSGDTASRETAIGLAEYVLNIEDGRQSPFRWLSRADTGRSHFTPPGYFGPSRASGNSLNALVDGHRLTGDIRFLNRAEVLIRRVVHPADDIARNQLDEPEIRWFYTMFLQALGKYLAHRAERGLIDQHYGYGRAALLHYARWMATHEYPWLSKPEKLEFPTETWAAQDIRKSDIFCYAAMHADGQERETFLERAEFFYRHSCETLATMPTRTLARPVIVMLTSGFLWPWMATHRDARLTDGPSIEPEQPVRFEPQRKIAERRAMLVVVAGGLLMVALAMAMFLVWR